MKTINILVVFLPAFFCSVFLKGSVADLIIFSYDRPLQLYALLESLENNVEGLGQVTVLYRTSNDEYARAYKIVQNTFNKVVYVKQGPKPEQDFKPLTLQAVFDPKSDYIVCAVDDMIVTDAIDLYECAELLESSSAYAFYLRLGKNITFDYQSGRVHTAAPGKLFGNNAYVWNFIDGVRAWNYPHTVDMAMYRKIDIEAFLKSTPYSNPNELEARWSKNVKNSTTRQGICYEHSKVINIPLNRVQETFTNKNMQGESTQELLALFNSGYKIDLRPLMRIANRSTHMDYTFAYSIRE